MKIKRKVATIIYRVKKGKPEFLILHRILNWTGWEFVKETIERGETPKQALVRGIQEETSLKGYEVVKRLGKRYQFGKMNKVVEVYLLKAPNTAKVDINQRVMEHNRYRWVSKKRALELLTYPEMIKILRSLNRNIFK